MNLISTPDKTAVILCNLGSPLHPTKKEYVRFLKEFLSDPRIRPFNRAVWWLVLNLVILPARATQTVSKYKKIWLSDGSPIRVITQKQVNKLRISYDSNADEREGKSVDFFMAMTYGEGKLELVLSELSAKDYSKVLVFPLYPQFSATSTGSIYDRVAQHFLENRNFPDIRVVKNYHCNEKYISALADSVTEFWKSNGRGELLVMSYHGIPEADCLAGDPYEIHCKETSALLAAKLGLKKNQWVMTFQSRVGRQKWLQPYTSDSVKNMANHGTKTIDVMCPGFSADCLETLEEIEVENRDFFIQAGGEFLRYIPALNDAPTHIQMMKSIVQSYLCNW